MDNVVQNININDIIPSNYQPNTEEKRKIEELAQMAKSFGLLDPIVVRPKNGKYEIVLGFEKYEAAKIAKLSKVPVLVKDMADDVFMQYTNIGNNVITKSMEPPPKETFSNNTKNNDIINLKELNKERIEYERDDFKMNNDMLNNNLGQVPASQNEQGPTFGGKFFPSLEDEPTNMNMMGGLNSPAPAPMGPSNNNLIDLTDLSPDKEAAPSVPDFSVPSTNLPPMDNSMIPNMNGMELPNMGGVPSNLTGPVSTDNVLNVSNLQNSVPATPVAPTPEPVSMETLQADFGGPASMPNSFDQPMPNEFNVPQNIGTPDLNLNQSAPLGPIGPNIEPAPMMGPQVNDNFGLNQAPVAPSNLGQVPDFNTPPMPMPNMGPDLNINPTLSQPTIDTAPVSSPTIDNVGASKDVTPVVSCLKAMASNLELFGYKININEEDLPNMAKITIEIEK